MDCAQIDECSVYSRLAKFFEARSACYVNESCTAVVWPCVRSALGAAYGQLRLLASPTAVVRHTWPACSGPPVDRRAW